MDNKITPKIKAEKIAQELKLSQHLAILFLSLAQGGVELATEDENLHIRTGSSLIILQISVTLIEYPA